MVEDRGTVLGADISTLPVERSWIVDGEEDLQEFSKGGYLGVERDLDYLGMPRRLRADLAVGRVHYRATGVARLDMLDPAQLVEDRFQAPEAAARQGRHLGFSTHRCWLLK
jgi:hypothetical protein